MEREHAVDASSSQKGQTIGLVTARAEGGPLGRRADRPGAVCPAGDQGVDEQLVTVTGSNVEGSVSVLIHAVDLPTWHGQVNQSRARIYCTNKKRCIVRLTILNEGLGASEASMNGGHVKRTLPVAALNNTKPFLDSEQTTRLY